MRRRWNIWRAISAGLALCLFGFAVKCFSDARRFRKQFEEWEIAKQIDVAVDLSTPGEIVAPFHQTCSSSHSQIVGLRVPAVALRGITIAELLDGAKARIEIRRKSDTNVIESAELDSSRTGDVIDGAIPIFFISPFQKGEYEARLKVIAGAFRLKGVPQSLEGRYLLCGLEAMPAEIARFGGIGSSALGGLVAMILLYRLVRVPPRSQTNSGVPEGPPSGELTDMPHDQR